MTVVLIGYRLTGRPTTSVKNCRTKHKRIESLVLSQLFTVVPTRLIKVRRLTMGPETQLLVLSRLRKPL